MEVFIRFGVGIMAALLGAAIIYAFRVRQLYLLIPRMYSHCALFDQGKLVEIKIFNRGNNMEEDVEIVMPPEFKCELLASELPDIGLQYNIIKIRRLPQKSEASILLLVEGKINEHNFSPSLTSKLAKGRKYKKQDEIPPNFGSVVLMVSLFLSFFSFVLYVPGKYFEYRNVQEAEREALARTRYSYLDESGWRGIDRYIDSGLSKAYSEFEFPLVLRSASLKGDVFSINFSAVNKTASIFKITAYFQFAEAEQRGSISKDSIFDLEVPPMGSKDFVVSMKYDDSVDIENVVVSASIKYANDFLWGLKLFPGSNKTANEALRQKHH